MGIGPGWFAIFRHICEANGIKPGDAILDIGASELFLSNVPEEINEMLLAFGAPLYPHDELIKIADRAFAAEVFRRAGFRYAAIDYADFPGVIRRDLNRQGLPWRHWRRYALVINCGTSEHILNQYNVFKAIHDACAVGGVMYHGVPGWGDYEHSIIEYSPKFFWALATDNQYEILMFEGVIDTPAPVELKPDFMRQLRLTRAPMSDRVWYHVILRKKSPRPFSGLNDPAFSAHWTTPKR